MGAGSPRARAAKVRASRAKSRVEVRKREVEKRRKSPGAGSDWKHVTEAGRGKGSASETAAADVGARKKKKTWRRKADKHMPVDAGKPKAFAKTAGREGGSPSETAAADVGARKKKNTWRRKADKHMPVDAGKPKAFSKSECGESRRLSVKERTEGAERKRGFETRSRQRGAALRTSEPGRASDGEEGAYAKDMRRGKVRWNEVRPARTAFLGALLVISLAALLWIYTGTGVLNVKRVEVRGNEVLDADYIRAMSGINGDTHLIKINVTAVERALLSEPYVAAVHVSRRFPCTVILEVEERKPTGVVFQNGKCHLVDQEGRVLESVDEMPPGMVEIKELDLPLLFSGMEITGMDFANVTSLLGSLPPSLREMTSAVGVNDTKGLYLEGGGTVVFYGEATSLTQKNEIALEALDKLVNDYGEVEYIDVSFPEYPVIKPLQK